MISKKTDRRCKCGALIADPYADHCPKCARERRLKAAKKLLRRGLKVVPF